MYTNKSSGHLLSTLDGRDWRELSRVHLRSNSPTRPALNESQERSRNGVDGGSVELALVVP